MLGVKFTALKMIKATVVVNFVYQVYGAHQEILYLMQSKLNALLIIAHPWTRLRNNDERI